MATSTPNIMGRIVYEGDLHTSATHLRSGNVIVTDGPIDNRGRGEAFSPTDLFATALASCILSIMGIAAMDRDIDMAGTTAEVVKEMDGPPRHIAAVRIVIRFPAKPFTASEKRILEKAAESCPVGRSIHPNVEQDVKLIWSETA
ncbi:MAG: OsmC family protein [Saprospiraceae bacterium]